MLSNTQGSCPETSQTALIRNARWVEWTKNFCGSLRKMRAREFLCLHAFMIMTIELKQCINEVQIQPVSYRIQSRA